MSNIITTLKSYLPDFSSFTNTAHQYFSEAIESGIIRYLIIAVAIVIGLVVTYFLAKFLWWLLKKIAVGIVWLYKAIRGAHIYDRLKKTQEAGMKIPDRVHRFLHPEKQPLEESFYTTVKLLRTAFGDKNAVYELPWYLVLGDTGSGKTSLLKSLNIKQPFAIPPKIENKNLPCDWHYFDYGVLLDIKGDVVYDDKGKSSKSQNWNEILGQLNYHRNRRPLDGVILILSCEDLIGPKKLSSIQLRQKANTLYKKFVHIQNILCMRVPVYFVLTKTDCITGFTEFAESFSDLGKLNDIFGWSSSHGLKTSFHPSWLDEAYTQLVQRINNLKLQTFTAQKKHNNLTNKDAIFLFPEEFEKLWDGMKAFLSQLFSENLYDDAHILRGIYFTGGVPTTIDAFKDENHIFAPRKVKTNIIFANKLFVNKIFKERNLAYPSYHLTNKLKKNITKTKVALSCSLATLTLLSVHSQKSFTKSKDILLSTISDMKSVIIEANEREQGGASLTKDQISEYGKHLLHFINVLSDDVKYWSFFISPSWFSSYKKDLYAALGLCFDRLLVNNVHREIQSMVKTLLNIERAEKNENADASIFDLINRKISTKVNPEKTRYFVQLKKFVDTLTTLEKIVENYNEFFITRRKENLFSILDDTYNYKFPSQFKDDFDLYVWYIDSHSFKKINLEKYKDAITRNLTNFFDDFATYAVEKNSHLKRIFKLNTLLDEVTDLHFEETVSLEDFFGVYEALKDAINISYNQSEMSWVSEKMFNPGTAYTNLISYLRQSKFVQKSLVDKQVSRIQTAYAALRDNIVSSYSQLLDENIYKVNFGNFQPNKKLSDLKEQFDKFVQEPSMEKVDDRPVAMDVTSNKVIMWDMKLLTTADKMLSSYQDFLEKRLEQYPQKIRPLFEKVARAQLLKNLWNYLGHAQYLSSVSVDVVGSDPEDKHKNVSKDLGNSWPILKRILSELSHPNDITDDVIDLNTALAGQALTILKDIDSILQKEGILTIRDGNFKWWNGEGNPILLGFNVPDIPALEDLFDIQIRRVTKLARDHAKPIVNLLSSDFFQLNKHHKALVRKWHGILDQTLIYEKKKAANSIGDLVKFYSKDLKDLNLKNINSTVKKFGNLPENDYFQELRVSVVEALKMRSGSIGDTKVLEQYQRITNYFNAYLAGKFPFVDGANYSTEADADHVLGFFKLYAENDFKSENYIKALRNKEPGTKNKESFLQKVDDLYKLFKPYIDNPQSPPAITMQVFFKQNKSNSPNIKNLVTHKMEIDSSEVSDGDNGKMLVWQLGSPIEVRFSIIDDGSISIRASDSDNIISSDDEIVFSFDGQWALFKMIAEMKASSVHYTKSGSVGENLLRFKIPTTDTARTNDNAITFIKLVLSSVDPKAPFILNGFPDFPKRAPELSDKSKSSINNLTKKNAQTSSEEEEEDDVEADEEEDDNE